MNILLVEDRPEDAFLVRKQLRQEGGPTPPEILHVETLGAALERLAQPGIDCVLLDLGLPDGRGLNNLRRVQDINPDVPVVILSGVEDERTAASAVQTGAFAYIVKRPPGAAEALLPVLEDAIAARARAQEPAVAVRAAGLLRLDSDGIIRAWDDRCYAIVRRPAEEVIGQPILELVGDSHRADIRRELDHAAASSDPVKLHLQMADGHWRLMTLTPHGPRDAQGQQEWSLSDAEQERSAQQALQVLDVIMEAVSDAVFSQDLDGTLHNCSRSLSTLTGIPREQLIGSAFVELVAVQDHGATEAILQALRRGRVVRDLDLHLNGAGGQVIAASLTLAPLRDEFGGLIGACILARRKDTDRQQPASLREKLHLEQVNARLRDEVDELRAQLQELRAHGAGLG
ncbi:MAG: PAS domain-containing protein [Oceanococcaceae bacterium]